MKTTRILLFFLAVFMAQGVMADNEYLAVWKKSGEVVYYDLSEEPVTTYADGNLKITTSSMSVTYPLEEVLKYTYTDTPTDIVQAKAPSVKVKQGRNSISFTNLKLGSSVNVYGAEGKMLRTQIVKTEVTVVDLSDFPLGVYMVTANGVTYKLARQ